MPHPNSRLTAALPMITILAIVGCDAAVGAPLDASVDASVVDSGPETAQTYALTIRGQGYAALSSLRYPVREAALAVWDQETGLRVHWERRSFDVRDDAFEVVIDGLLEHGHRYRVATHGLVNPDESMTEVAAVEGDVEVEVDFRTEGDPEGFFLTSEPVSVLSGRYEWDVPGPDGRLLIGVSEEGFLYRMYQSYGACGTFTGFGTVGCQHSGIFNWADRDSISLDANDQSDDRTWFFEGGLTVVGGGLRLEGRMGSNACSETIPVSTFLTRIGDLDMECTP